LMRRLFSSAAVGAAAAVLFGDVSTVLAALPALLIDLDYSREMEREADSFAIELLRANGISTGSLATLFERMQDAQEKRGPKNDWPTYLSTHPPTPERVESFRTPAK
jgi:predicted Zn-dependent protease